MSEFSRIFTPRTEKAVKAISLLANGVRYKPDQDEKDQTLNALKEAVNSIAELYGMLPGGEPTSEDTSAPVDDTESRVEASRLDAKIELVKRSAFARQDVHENVASIPEAQITAYATHIVARLCGKFEEAEAKPKNYVAKEE